MSRPSAAYNEYTNGNYERETMNRYDDDRQNKGVAGESRERRVGGYGGFVNDTVSVPLDNERQTASQHQSSDANLKGSHGHLRPDRRDADWNNSSRNKERNGANLGHYGSGPGGRQIEGQQLPHEKLTLGNTGTLLDREFFFSIGYYYNWLMKARRFIGPLTNMYYQGFLGIYMKTGIL